MQFSNAYVSQFDLNITDYKPLTKLDIDWIQTSNMNYDPIVRSSSNDTYDAIITTAGTESYINSLLSGCYNELINSLLPVNMSGFASDEKIFGEDINYTGVMSGYIYDWGEVEQTSWRGYKTTLKMRLLSPTFSSAAALPNFSSWCASPNYKGGGPPTTFIQDTFNGAYIYRYNKTYNGIIEFDVNLTNSELGGFRRYVAENRGTSINISGINNLVYPFGPQLSDVSYNVKVLELQEISRFNINRWIVHVKLANITSKI